MACGRVGRPFKRMLLLDRITTRSLLLLLFRLGEDNKDETVVVDVAVVAVLSRQVCRLLTALDEILTRRRDDLFGEPPWRLRHIFGDDVIRMFGFFGTNDWHPNATLGRTFTKRVNDRIFQE